MYLSTKLYRINIKRNIILLVLNSFYINEPEVYGRVRTDTGEGI